MGSSGLNVRAEQGLAGCSGPDRALGLEGSHWQEGRLSPAVPSICPSLLFPQHVFPEQNLSPGNPRAWGEIFALSAAGRNREDWLHCKSKVGLGGNQAGVMC